MSNRPVPSANSLGRKGGLAFLGPVHTSVLQAAFGPGADFTGLSPVNPPLGSVVQKTYVRVDEESTEAAAATGEPSEPPVIVDRPFAFTINDAQTGTVLFLGSIHDPRG